MRKFTFSFAFFTDSAIGINTPLFYLAHQISSIEQLNEKMLTLQVFMGCAWILGCVIFGLLVVKNSVECRIARQYLCQTAMFMCGLSMLALTTIEANYQAYCLFVWIYGEFELLSCWHISRFPSHQFNSTVKWGIKYSNYILIFRLQEFSSVAITIHWKCSHSKK